MSSPTPRSADSVLNVLTAGRTERLVQLRRVPGRAGAAADWPDWLDPNVLWAMQSRGIDSPWTHQSEAAESAWAGDDTVLSTGTASGKSLAYLMPVLTALRSGRPDAIGRAADRGTAMYLAPTKALAADQLSLIQQLAVPGVVPAAVDGDAGTEERTWARQHANYLLSNPDMLHRSLLPGHRSWERFWRRLAFVVVDEAHVYRGVFGSGVAATLRRLRRVAANYGAEPVFVLASATMAQPEVLAERLIGRPVHAVTADGSPAGGVQLAVWQPPDLPARGERGAPVRRGVVAEKAELLADLVRADVQTLAFVRSRRAAEAVAAMTADSVAQTHPGLRDRVAAYRGGFLPEERRELEKALRQRSLLGVATTSALELGVDLPGVDAVLVAGWPGTHASLRQQAGRAGRTGQEAVAAFIARDEPLDSYFLAHPDALWSSRIETTVVDPDNPYVLAGHLLAAAAEVPITDVDLPLFGPGAAQLLDRLSAQGSLRRRDSGWFWTGRGRPVDSVDLRGSGQPVRVAEADTGRLLGTVDAGSADRTVHPGAVYVHQGAAFRVESLDQEDAVAIAHPDDSGESTTARVVTDLRILSERDRGRLGLADLVLGEVEVTSQVVSYLIRRADTGEVLGERPLEMPGRSLRTVAVWWTLPEPLRERARVDDAALAGAAHAAEHAAIGLLPLFATCDRWDIGGLSTAAHPDTGTATVFVHDGHPGGAGFAERGFHKAAEWLQATAELVSNCRCQQGCPACVQSPKCGNGNNPLDKSAAAALLQALLESD